MLPIVMFDAVRILWYGKVVHKRGRGNTEVLLSAGRRGAIVEGIAELQWRISSLVICILHPALVASEAIGQVGKWGRRASWLDSASKQRMTPIGDCSARCAAAAASASINTSTIACSSWNMVCVRLL